MVRERGEEKKHFVLVHGFCHGAWCWYKLAAALKSRGCRATAVDLGAAPSSFSDFIRPLMDLMSSLPDDGDAVVLVGHSYGGIPISVAMENFPAKISVAVFLTAYMPNCTDPPAALIDEYFKRTSRESLVDCEFTFDKDVPISAIFGQEYMAAKLYGNCSAEDLELANMLIRPSSIFLEELRKKMLSEEKYGVVKRCYVICEDDEVMDQEFQKYNIEKSPPHQVISIAAAGHMPMISKPHHLASCLFQISEKF